MKNMKEKLKQLLINFTLKYLLNAVLISDVIKFDKKTGVVYINNQVVTKDEARNLRNEADYFQKSRLWKILIDSPAREAEKKIFIHSLTVMDSVAGKTMLYNVDVQRKILEICRNLKVDS